MFDVHQSRPNRNQYLSQDEPIPHLFLQNVRNLVGRWEFTAYSCWESVQVHMEDVVFHVFNQLFVQCVV